MKALIELLDHLEVERVFRPGRLGRRYGGAHPGHTKGLILCSPAMHRIWAL